MKKIALIIVSILFFSCEKVLMKAEPKNNPESIFNQVWEFADKKYSFFKLKNIDWNKIKEQYKGQISNSMTEQQLFDICADMLYNLNDGHVNLSSNFDRSRNWSIFYNSPQNFDKNILERNYFNATEKYFGPFIMKDFGDVLYVYYGSFMNGMTRDNLDLIIANCENKKGLILDVRDNSGGIVSNVDLICQRFISKDYEIGKEYFKSGSNHEDFSERKLTLKYKKNLNTNVKIPIMLLTNRTSYSATNFFTMYMRALPQVTQIGDFSGGGGGIPATTELSNGWKLRVSSTQTIDNKGKNIELGIGPNIKIDITENDLRNGKDTILDTALNFIRNL